MHNPEVAQLRDEISALRALIGAPTSDVANATLHVRIERTRSERKPLKFIFTQGNVTSVSLSYTRGAIVIALLADLVQRISGNSRPLNMRDVASRIVAVLNGGSWTSDDSLSESIRVGFYRSADFWEKTLKPLIGLTLHPEREHLDLPAENLRIEFASDDADLKHIFSTFGRSPFVERLKEERTLMVKSGNGEIERVLLEIYSLPGMLTVHTIYNRPALISLPHHLAKRSASPTAYQRYQLMHDRLHEQTLSVCEIVPEREFRSFIANSAEDSHSYSLTSGDQHLEHLNWIQDLMRSRKNYRLACVAGEVPFYVGLYRTEEHAITAFYQFPQARGLGEMCAFFSIGESLLESVADGIIRPLLNSPKSVRSAEGMVGLINELSHPPAKSVSAPG